MISMTKKKLKNEPQGAIQVYIRKMGGQETRHYRAPPANVIIVAQIDGNVSEKLLQVAITKARIRHPLIGTKVIKDEQGQYWFSSEQVADPELKIIPRESENHWQGAIKRENLEPFNFSKGPLTRFLLLQSTEACDLVAICHHCMCDGMSVAYLVRDILSFLGNPEKKPVPFVKPPLSPEIMPPEATRGLKFKSIRWIIKKVNQNWNKSPHPQFTEADSKAIHHAYWDNFTMNLTTAEFSSAETRALVEKCRRERVTVNTALVTAFRIASSEIVGNKIPGIEKTMVAVNVRDRLPEPVGEAMGLYAAGNPLKLKFKSGTSFWEIARGFHEEIQEDGLENKDIFGHIIKYEYLDPDIQQMMRFASVGRLVPPSSPQYEKLSGLTGEKNIATTMLKKMPFDKPAMGLVVTNLGNLDFPTQYGDLELKRAFLAPATIPFIALAVAVISVAGRLSICLPYVESSIDTPTVTRIKNRALDLLSIVTH